MRRKRYSPAIHRFIVSCLYHEAKRRGVKMTVLANQLLINALSGGDGWQAAMKQLQEQSSGK